MSNLYRMLSFFAVVNLIALLIFVGWLWRTDRLDQERVRAVRDVFATTITEAKVADEMAASDAAVEDARLAEEAERLNPPRASAHQLNAQERTREQANLALSRMDDDRRLLMQQLDGTTAGIQKREDDLAREREAWTASVEGERSRKTNEQFRKAVQQLESIPAKQAKSMVQNLVAQGKQDQAVAYLDAMKPRSRSRILREFKSVQENQLATELLEQLRTFGLPAGDREETSYADATPPAQ